MKTKLLKKEPSQLYTKMLLGIVILLILVSTSCKKTAIDDAVSLQQKELTKKPLPVPEDGSFNYFILGDWGRNGNDIQKDVAEQMTKVAQKIEPEFIMTVGDNHQINGIQSVTDPLWLTSFEYIYDDGSLQVDWYPILGNHDYRGNPEAQIQYSNISRRWKMPAHYYTFTKKIDDGSGESIRFICLDTSPFNDEYWEELDEYHVTGQDTAAQMVWLRNVLVNTREKWILVYGHHPAYSSSPKHGNNPDIIKRLRPLFDQYKVDFYFSGHEHDVQHQKPQGCTTDYFVTGTGSEIRATEKNENSLFAEAVPAFAWVSAMGKSITVNIIKEDGSLIYSYKKEK